MSNYATAGDRGLPDPEFLPGGPWRAVGYRSGNALLGEEMIPSKMVSDTIARWPSDTCSAWAMGIFLSIWAGYEDYDGRGIIGYYGA